jgi:8-oxo-dGTP pyrophosphatase MutT (NUDIX family)
MKKYTIGALFTPDYKRVLLILKTKPDWQKGKFNLPGGSIEDGETCFECVAREFKEETDLDLPADNWQHIGKIDNPGNYFVDFLTTICYSPENVKSLTNETCLWFDCDALPDACISNLHWLIPFALNIWKQGNADGLTFGTFQYSY